MVAEVLHVNSGIMRKVVAQKILRSVEAVLMSGSLFLNTRKWSISVGRISDLEFATAVSKKDRACLITGVDRRIDF